jgi:uncharacterized protein (DUF2236 family)
MRSPDGELAGAGAGSSGGSAITVERTERRHATMITVDVLRDRIAGAVSARIVGEGADARRAELFDAPGPRWFTDDRPVRRVHADPAMFIGGLRALLLQALHPLAMAGVAEHSDYRRDPWGRLQRTADFLAATTFGPAHEAERAVARVRAVHRRVRGVAPDGRPYAADDPHLLRWVHLAEVDSFLTAHQHFGASPLSAAECDGYVADLAVVASALGVPAPPRSVRDQLRSYRPELASTAEARAVARYLVLTPPLPPVPRAAYGVLAAAAVSLLPRWARWPLRLPYAPVTERAIARPAGDSVVRVLRWALARP